MKFNFSDNYEFEAFVRKLARECWDTNGYNGAVTVNKRERDGILENDHHIFLLRSNDIKIRKTYC